MAIIDILIAENVDAIVKNKGLPEEVAKFIRAVVNPSAFRQRLEKEKLLNPSTPRAAKINNLFAGF